MKQEKKQPAKRRPKYVCGECGVGKVWDRYKICRACQRKVRKELGQKGTPINPKESEIPF